MTCRYTCLPIRQCSLFVCCAHFPNLLLDLLKHWQLSLGLAKWSVGVTYAGILKTTGVDSIDLSSMLWSCVSWASIPPQKKDVTGTKFVVKNHLQPLWFFDFEPPSIPPMQFIYLDLLKVHRLPLFSSESVNHNICWLFWGEDVFLLVGFFHYQTSKQEIKSVYKISLGCGPLPVIVVNEGF